jgi:polyhydroxyalkanoate synthase
MWDSIFEWMNETAEMTSAVQRANVRAAGRNMALATNFYRRLLGLPGQDVVAPDQRFQDESWAANPLADLMKQAYLVGSEWMMELVDTVASGDPALQQRARFWTQQYVDAMSPANFALTNPEVWRETARSGGLNLAEGARNFLSDLQKGRLSQVPDDAFLVGEDLATTEGQVIYRNRLIELIQYTPTTPKVKGIPLLVIAPWINKYYVLDMRPDNSLIKYLVHSGITVFAISWKNPDESILDLTWDDYMDLGPLDAIRVVKEITGSGEINVAGYCLGGIILQVTLAYLAAQGDESVKSATFFTTHQDYSDAGEISVFISQPEVAFLEWLMDASGGYLDGRNLAATFNLLRSNDLLWNYVVQNYLLGQQPPAFDLLYWNNDGTRVPKKVHSFLLREFFLDNKLMVPGGIKVKGVDVNLGRVKTPTYAVAASRDHIVPWRGAFRIRELQGGPVRFILTGGGHIAGIVNPPAEKKRAYWVKDDGQTDPDQWLDGATRHDGSWWEDWLAWLKKKSGRQAAPPTMGNEEYPALIGAPGSYVLEK